MKRKDSLIARSIDREYKNSKRHLKKFSKICGKKVCDKCNYNEYCEIAEVNNEFKSKN